MRSILFDIQTELQQTKHLGIYTEWNRQGNVREDRITNERWAQSRCTLSKYSKCDN